MVSLAEVGRALGARRRALGLTQSALAEAIGARPVLVGRWERGEAVPTRDEAMALAEALDLDPQVADEWATAAERLDARAEAPTPAAAGSVWNDVSSPARLRHRWLSFRRSGSAAVAGAGKGSPPGTARRPLADPGAEGVSLAPLPLREPSYLDDPVEQRRYARRWTLTILVLGLLAVALIWALGELREGWGAFLDLFRGRAATGGLANALGLIGSV